jgi:hypothetical protein
VALFYKALLQESPPTLEQERTIFSDQQWIRDYLVAQGRRGGHGAVVLDFFRAHRDLFIPANMKPTGIQISSTFDFPRNAQEVKYKPGTFGGGWVMAAFVRDVNAHPAHQTEVVFQMFTKGKIDADAIYIGGFGGKMIGEEFFGMK